ncbi:hypothetical protein FGB62_59g034 [Gracilaria domingensis]|nr:hypothetical protein FGB62_59g034 [Gracilaria domingensis]
MTRKRPLQNPETSSTKRYLNGALAAELRGLRISGTPVAPQPLQKNAFGVSVPPSPFYSNNVNSSNSLPTFIQSPSGVVFGSDFAGSLPTEPLPHLTQNAIHQNHVVANLESPNSSLSSAPMDEDDVESRSIVNISEDRPMEEMTLEQQPPLPSNENRVVVYRPPIRTKSNIVSRVNAVLPDGTYILRNPKTDDWILTARNRSESGKRKLALVPWSGDPHKKLRDSLRQPSRVIPMPWHDSPTKVTVVQPADEVPATTEEEMEIEEVV